MIERGADRTAEPAGAAVQSAEDEDGDLGDLLLELRIALQGAQLLTAFLITLPFSAGFAKVRAFEKGVYVATFLSAITALVLFSAPAVHHRLERPVRNRERFKRFATRLMLAGLIPLSLALVLATGLVIEEAIGRPAASVLTVLFAVFLGVVWWAVPLLRRRKDQAKNPD